ncbi:MAG: type II toxin-antitoxin system HicA family toxin [Chloroflexi bacterium]|nr:type II toxin-antitoxin system HicA family toxin [Chloroflexota bacterium]
MNPTMPRVTAQQVLRVMRKDGWTEVRRSGSHVSLRHPSKPGLVVIPMHSARTVRLGTLAKILKDAGLTVDEFRRLL